MNAKVAQAAAPLALLGALALAAARSPRSDASAWSGDGRRGSGDAEPRTERAWSVQLHLHGPASEGPGSVDSHSREAELAGVDVLWWSEHDWRAAGYRAASSFGFEGTEALDENEPWSARWSFEAPELGGEPDAKARRAGKQVELRAWSALDTERAFEGEASLRISAAGRGGHPSTGPEPEGEWLLHLRELRAGRARFKRPLAAGITLRLAVLPSELGPDVRPELRLELSEHPARDAEGSCMGGPEAFATWELVYRLVDEDLAGELAPGLEAAAAGGLRLVVPVPARAGEWNRLVLPVSADAEAAFGEFGPDNSLARIALGLSLRAGSEARPSVHFDAFELAQEAAGQAALERQAKVVERVARRYPGLRELSGLEVSYLEPHLNVYGPGLPSLPDYEALLAVADAARIATEHGSEPDVVADGAAVARAVVADAHARGALVSFNHLFGTDMERDRQEQLTGEVRPREELLAELAANRLFGADLLEVGYRDRGGHGLADHLWVWDRLADEGLFPVGTGVSDSHGGPDQRWLGGGNNFVSWILAPSPDASELLAGLAAGRVFFGDIERFDGRLDLETERGFRMGQVIVSDRPAARVRALLEGPGEGLELHWIRDGDPAGPTARPDELELELGSGRALVRLELRRPGGEPVALSNPVHFLREVPPGGLSAARAAVDLSGVRTRALARLRLAGAGRADEGVWLELEAQGDGSAELLLDDPGAVYAVELEAPLSGSVERAGGRVLLSELSGRGRALLRCAP